MISRDATLDVCCVRLTWLLILAFRKNRHNTKLFSSATWPADIPMQIAEIEFKFADRTRSSGYQIPLALGPCNTVYWVSVNHPWISALLIGRASCRERVGQDG